MGASVQNLCGDTSLPLPRSSTSRPPARRPCRASRRPPPRHTDPGWQGVKGFVGGTTTPATGLTHLGARDYDPTTGRFISVDPLLDTGDSQSLDGYAYAGSKTFGPRRLRPTRSWPPGSGALSSRTVGHPPEPAKRVIRTRSALRHCFQAITDASSGPSAPSVSLDKSRCPDCPQNDPLDNPAGTPKTAFAGNRPAAEIIPGRAERRTPFCPAREGTEGER